MIEIISQMMSYPFMVRAFAVGIMISLCAALLGVSLVLKRYAMIGEGLSHVGFGTIAIAMAFNLAPLYVSIPGVVISAFLLLRISENSKIKGDSAIAIISSSALAIGVISVSITSGMSVDVCNFMFGSILGMSISDVKLSLILAVIVLILFCFFYHKLFAVTFDENFASASGIKTGFYNSLLAVLTSVTIVLGMRMMGTLLISSLLVFPSLTSMRIFKSFKAVVLSSAAVSVFCFLTGMTLSYILSTPTGASVVLTNLVIFIVFSAISILKRRLVR